MIVSDNVGISLELLELLADLDSFACEGIQCHTFIADLAP